MWKCILFLISLSAFSQTSFLARSSFVDGYNLPRLCFFLDAKPLYFQNHVYLKVTCLEDPLHSQIWEIDLNDKKSSLIFQASANHLVTDPILYQDQVWWSEFNETHTTQILKYKDNLISKVTFPTEDSFARIVDMSAGENLVIRYESFEGEQKIYQYKNDQWSLLLDAQLAGLSYLFSPQVLGNKIILKTRLGQISERNDDRPDEIILVDDKNKKVLLQDINSNPQSPYLSFRNSVVVREKLWSVMAKTKDGDVLIVGDEDKILKIYSLSNYFKEISYFSWGLSPQADVVLRAIAHHENREKLWFLNSNKLQKLLDQEDSILTDQGTSQLTHNQPFTTSVMASDMGYFIGVGLNMLDRPELSESMGLILICPVGEKITQQFSQRLNINVR